MKHIIIQSLLLAIPALLFAQGGLVNDGAIMKVMANTDVQITGGGVINKANGTINNEGNIYLDLDWTQTGAATNYLGSGWMWFEGGANQNISSASVLTVPRLRVDNGNVLILNNNVHVSTQVDLMNNGNIELGPNNLVIEPGANIVNYDANNYIITNGTGTLQQEVAAANVVFPVGNSAFNPATINNSGTVDNIRIRVFDQVNEYGTSGPLKSSNVVGRTWMIDEEVLGGSNVAMTLQWTTPEELAFDRLNSGIAHHLSGAIWDNPPTYTAATNVGANTWTQTRGGFTSFSPFVVRDLNSDLPVEYLLFEAKRTSKEIVQLDWTTASETNNMGFEIERMLDNESSFSKIGWVDGQGTTTFTTNYQLNDQNAHRSISYYRLKQVDFDGSFHYSPVRAVSGYEDNSNSVSIYPVPTRNVLNVDFSNWAEDETTVQFNIVDVLGRVLISKQVLVEQNSIVKLYEVKDLLPGSYFLSATSEDGLNFVRKFTRTED